MVEAANLVDIIMMSLQSGRLICVHLKKDSILFTLKQKKAATAIVFSADSPWMATGDELGNIILWDLQQKKILYKM